MSYLNTSIFEKIPVLSKHNQTVMLHKKIKYPTLNDKWFYFIEKKNITMLQEMLNDGFSINQLDQEGATIAYYCIYQKSSKLLNFSIKNQANFQSKDLDNISPLYMVFSHCYKCEAFKKVIKLFVFEDLLKDTEFLTNLTTLSQNDNNLNKLKFLFQNYAQHMEIFRPDLISQARSKGALKSLHYLTGKETLHDNLTKNLDFKNTPSKIHKI